MIQMMLYLFTSGHIFFFIVEALYMNAIRTFLLYEHMISLKDHVVLGVIVTIAVGAVNLDFVEHLVSTNRALFLSLEILDYALAMEQMVALDLDNWVCIKTNSTYL